MAFETIRLEIDGLIARLTLNRPEKRNALTPVMISEITQALEEAASSTALVMILTGAGEAFCSGMDIGALQSLSSHSVQDAVEDSRRIAAMFRALYNFPKAVISVVRGAAVAGGCGLATLTDFTLSEPETKFGYPEVRIGFIPAIVSVFLVRQIGEKRAGSLLLSGRLFGAEEGRELGLVSEIIPNDQLAGRADKLAEQLLSVSLTSIRYTKRLLRDVSAAELAREIELAIEANARIRSTDNFKEGISAYFEKRKPGWRSDG